MKEEKDNGSSTTTMIRNLMIQDDVKHVEFTGIVNSKGEIIMFNNTESSRRFVFGQHQAWIGVPVICQRSVSPLDNRLIKNMPCYIRRTFTKTKREE